MKIQRQSEGFSAVAALVIVLVVAIIGAGGWYVWHKNQKKPANQSSTNTPANSEQSASNFQIPAGWVWYESKDMGLKFARPTSWTVDTPKAINTAAGEQGWTVNVDATNPQNGDPSLAISTYPGSATIKNVDAGVNDVKVQDITTADKLNVTLVGTIEDPSRVTKPTQMYLSSCWPRNCTPQLTNGRFLAVNAGSTNNDCTKGMTCPTEISTSGENYDTFVNILKSITSL